MALTTSTPLPTPRGWITVGEVEVGDYLYDELGYSTKVISVSEPYVVEETAAVFFGWGKKKYPELEYRCSVDQRFYTIGYIHMMKLAHPNSHLHDYTFKEQLPRFTNNWPEWGYGRQPIAQLNTPEEIGNTLQKVRKHGNRGTQSYYNHTVPIGFSLANHDGDYAVHPYVLGVCLNYWDFERGQLKILLEWFTYFREEFKKYGFDLVCETEVGDRTPRSAYIWCSAEGLGDLLGSERRIPDSYLRGSSADRVALLEGLMDIMLVQTMISERTRASINYSHPDRGLVADVTELVRSLGYPAYRLVGTDKRDRNDKDTIEWHPPEVPSRHPKMKVRLLPYTFRKGNPLERYVWKVYSSDIIEEKTEVKDIVVESPYKIYLAGKLFLPVVSDG